MKLQNIYNEKVEAYEKYEEVKDRLLEEAEKIYRILHTTDPEFYKYDPDTISDVKIYTPINGLECVEFRFETPWDYEIDTQIIDMGLLNKSTKEIKKIVKKEKVKRNEVNVNSEIRDIKNEILLHKNDIKELENKIEMMRNKINHSPNI